MTRSIQKGTQYPQRIQGQIKLGNDHKNFKNHKFQNFYQLYSLSFSIHSLTSAKIVSPTTIQSEQTKPRQGFLIYQSSYLQKALPIQSLQANVCKYLNTYAIFKFNTNTVHTFLYIYTSQPDNHSVL